MPPKFETLAIHAGQEPDSATGATVVPVYQTTTYTQDAIGSDRGFVYSRAGNPTSAALEGAHVVVHSTTKYRGGPSDVLGGAAVVDDAELHERLRFARTATGVVPGPWDAWLVLRGIKTLAVRMRQHQQNAAALAAGGR